MPSEKQAGAILSIDLAAIRANFRELQRRLGKTACAAVVKADGYGLGAVEVGSALAKEGCRIFFVVQAMGGLMLRQALGPGPEIHILNGIHPGAEDDCAAADLTAVCNSIEQLAAWRDAARRKGGGRLPVALQVDSGMSRLGMPPEDVALVARHAGAFDGLDLKLVMSHLACADEPAHPANEAQRREFDRLRAMLPTVPASLANSSGVFLGKAFHYDLARPGAALYGINPVAGRVNPMQQAVRLSAKVIQTRTIAAGTGIGYGHAMIADGSLRLATVALGYADGWPRRLGAAGWFDGVRLPFAGRVSMDSIILDLSALAPGRLMPGDLVEMIGPEQTVDDVAALAGTIGYEILTGLGGRFHRRYEGG